MHLHITRRRFLRTSLLASAGLTLAAYRHFPFSTIPQHIGVQLWSVREDMKKDPAGTLEAIAKMGYREVEPFGFDEGALFGLSYSDFNKILVNNGLTMPSTHSKVSFKNYNAVTGDITDDTKKWVDTAAGMGMKYLINPYMDAPDRPRIGKLVDVFQAMGKYCNNAGIRFAYHNHDFEYMERGPDNRLLIEWLLHETDPALMAMQMDIYWVSHANNNPVDWFRLYPGRWELCHVKDMADTERRESVEVGDGVIDFKSIFRNSKDAGLQYYVVELEDYKTTPLQGVEKARKGLIEIFS